MNTTEQKKELAEQIRSKVDELNALITEANELNLKVYCGSHISNKPQKGDGVGLCIEDIIEY
jgi:flagellar hook-associated protein FlgK